MNNIKKRVIKYLRAAIKFLINGLVYAFCPELAIIMGYIQIIYICIYLSKTSILKSNKINALKCGFFYTKEYNNETGKHVIIYHRNHILMCTSLGFLSLATLYTLLYKGSNNIRLTEFSENSTLTKILNGVKPEILVDNSNIDIISNFSDKVIQTCKKISIFAEKVELIAETLEHGGLLKEKANRKLFRNLFTSTESYLNFLEKCNKNCEPLPATCASMIKSLPISIRTLCSLDNELKSLCATVYWTTKDISNLEKLGHFLEELFKNK